MKTIVTVLFALFFLAQKALAVNYYVDAVNGSNSNNGLTPATAFQTLGKVSYTTTTLAPGDTVFVRNGTYGTTDLANVNSSFAVLAITQSGTEGSPIVFKNYPGESPLIQFNQWHGIYVQASYVVIDGIRIRGNSSVIDPVQATNQPSGCNDPTGTVQAKFNGNGISFDPNGASGFCHHVAVRNCEVWECCGGGINAIKADYITLEGNKVYNNAFYSRYGNSGISLFHLFNYDANTTTFRNVVRNNVIYGNEMRVPWYSGSCRGFTDGNGLIMDDNRNTQASGTGVVYSGKSLIENNVVYRNGGRGIHVYLSDSVTVINNTTYANNLTPAINDGEITAITTANVRLYNNVLYARKGKKLSTASASTNLKENNNLMYGNGAFGFFSNRDIFADPKFVDTAANNFRLQGTSPGINAGNDTTGNYTATDLVGAARPAGLLPEPGAYEYTAAVPVVPTFTSGALAVLRVGDGTTTISSAALPVAVVEYGVGGAATGVTVPLSGGNPAFTLGGNTASNINEGQLTLSSDGRYISAVGYNAATGTAEATMRASEKRIARLDYALGLDTTTSIPTANAFATNAVRNAVTDFGASFWVSSSTGFRTINMNAAASTAVTNANSARSVSRFGGKTYYINFQIVGINEPPAANVDLPGTTAGNGSQSIWFFDADGAVGYLSTGYDLLYRSEPDGGIRKFYYDGSTWVDAGLYNPAGIGGTGTGLGFTSFTARINASNLPEIYGIKGTGGNNYLIKLVDNSGRVSNWATATGMQATAATSLAQAGANYIFRGIAFTPTKYGTAPPQTIIVLPVKLSSFDAYLVNNDVVLNWATTSETASKEFWIERSKDGSSYSVIGKVAATARSGGATYRFADKNIGEGVFYYRLRSMDVDGKASLSKVVLIKNVKAASPVSVFPNPVAELLFISYPAVGGNANLSVVDMAGREVYKQTLAEGSRQTTVDVSRLTKGQYSVVIAIAEGSMVSKFIK